MLTPLGMERRYILLDPKGRRHWLPEGRGMQRVEGLGVVDLSRVEESVGRRIEVGGRPFLVLEASVLDALGSLRREAQTIGRKDVGPLLLQAGIGPGSRVVEGGSGSGSLTIALAWAIGPSGSVVSYDIRRDFLETARANVERAGLASRVAFREGDVRQGIEEREQDAVVLDIPDPWAAVPAAWEALRPCGHLASFSPNMEQVKETVAAIRQRPFVDIRTIELIEREIEVREVGVRPSHAPLGHTGYLTFARKVLDTF